MPMVFFDCPTAPNPRRVRMVIAEKGLGIETREISIAAGEHLAPGFLRINPRATLPVLVTEAGQALTETVAIADYLEALHPEPALMGRGIEERAAVLNWNAVVEGQGGRPVFDAFRNSHPAMQDRAVTGARDYPQIAALAERAQEQVADFHAMIEDRLQQSPFVATDHFTLADITCFVILDFARVIRRPVPAGNRATLSWQRHIRQRPSAAA